MKHAAVCLSLSLYRCVYVCVCEWVCLRVKLCVCVCLCMSLPLCVCVCLCVWVCVCLHASVSVFTNWISSCVCRHCWVSILALSTVTWLSELDCVWGGCVKTCLDGWWGIILWKSCASEVCVCVCLCLCVCPQMLGFSVEMVLVSKRDRSGYHCP